MINQNFPESMQLSSDMQTRDHHVHSNKKLPNVLLITTIAIFLIISSILVGVQIGKRSSVQKQKPVALAPNLPISEICEPIDTSLMRQVSTFESGFTLRGEVTAQKDWTTLNVNEIGLTFIYPSISDTFSFRADINSDKANQQSDPNGSIITWNTNDGVSNTQISTIISEKFAEGRDPWYDDNVAWGKKNDKYFLIRSHSHTLPVEAIKEFKTKYGYQALYAHVPQLLTDYDLKMLGTTRDEVDGDKKILIVNFPAKRNIGGSSVRAINFVFTTTITDDVMEKIADSVTLACPNAECTILTQ